MNREIKFRAWDKDEKRMTKGNSLKSICLAANVESFEWDDNLPIMQFTGLKDKNGKEIYEGDIVDEIGYAPQEIWFERGCWFIGIQDRSDKLLYDNIAERCVVIGNVFENPELLK